MEGKPRVLKDDSETRFRRTLQTGPFQSLRPFPIHRFLRDPQDPTPLSALKGQPFLLRRWTPEPLDRPVTPLVPLPSALFPSHLVFEHPHPEPGPSPSFAPPSASANPGPWVGGPRARLTRRWRHERASRGAVLTGRARASTGPRLRRAGGGGRRRPCNCRGLRVAVGGPRGEGGPAGGPVSGPRTRRRSRTASASDPGSVPRPLRKPLPPPPAPSGSRSAQVATVSLPRVPSLGPPSAPARTGSGRGTGRSERRSGEWCFSGSTFSFLFTEGGGSKRTFHAKAWKAMGAQFGREELEFERILANP